MQKSFVWKYFAREGGKARCKVGGCNSLLTAKATTPPFYHLENVHRIFKDKKSSSSTNVASTSQAQSQDQEVEDQHHEEPKPKKQMSSQGTIFDCFSFKSLEERVARMAAENGITIRQITARLSEYGICIDTDIIAATGDGASVMICFGREAPFEYVICLNHTINLAVLEVKEG